MDAVILAGGFATRMYPLTLNKAKPLLEVAGKPCILHIIESLFPLKEVGLKRIVVLSNERFAQDFRDELKGPYPVEVVVGSNGVMTLETKLGAIGDMQRGAEYCHPGEPFLILAGDNLYDFSLRPFVDEYLRRGEAPVVITQRVDDLAEIRKFNNMKLDADGKILEFVEKPAEPWDHEFATCMYAFPGDVQEELKTYLASGLDPDKAGFFIAWLAKRRPVYTFLPDGVWFDIGSMEDITRASQFFGK